MLRPALACFEDEWLALYWQNPAAVAGTLDLHAPAAYVRTPVKATPISACQRILDFYGEPYKSMRQEDLIRTVKNAVYDHGTKALVIDAGGIVGLLRKLVQEGCRHAIETGREQITTELLDTLALSPADLPGLDPTAGEVPDIPPPPAPASRKPRNPRNTLFDDRAG